MNRIYPFLLLSGLVFFAPIAVFADPSVKFPSGPAAWTVDVEDSQKPVASKFNPLAPSQQKQGAGIKRVDVAQNDQYLCSTITSANGMSRQAWSIVGSSMFITQDSKGSVYMSTPNRFVYVPFLPSTFNWVSPAYLQEKDPVSYQGKECFHYKGPDAEAWVEAKTLLPVAIDDGDTLATYKFLPSPTTALVLPDKYQQALDSYKLYVGAPPK